MISRNPFIRRVQRHLESGGRIPWVNPQQARGEAENAATDCLSAFQYVMFGIEMVGVSVGAYDVAWEDDPEFPSDVLKPSVHLKLPWSAIPEKYRLGESPKMPVYSQRVLNSVGEYYRVFAHSKQVLVSPCLTGNLAGIYVTGHWDTGEKTILFVSGQRGGVGYAGIPFTPNGGPVTFSWSGTNPWSTTNLVLNVKVE